MMTLKKRLTIERSYCSRTCNCVNKSEPNQKEKEEVLITTVVETRGGYGGNSSRGGDNRGGGNRGGY
jgi:dissimilatory sulfite reductase (desulfoviridin) alpha/beta subunit